MSEEEYRKKMYENSNALCGMVFCILLVSIAILWFGR